jgi:hypothetical protein
MCKKIVTCSEPIRCPGNSVPKAGFLILPEKVHSWFFHGSPMVLPWFFHGSPLPKPYIPPI